METMTIPVNVLAVSLESIVKLGIIVTIKPAITMANVRMEKLIILVIVNRNIVVQTVNKETTVIVAHVHMGNVLTLIPVINAIVL